MGRFFAAAALLAILPFPAMNASAATAAFYLGTYTHAGKSQGIYRGTLDTDTGALGPLVLAARADDPSFLALSPDERFLYAAIEAGPGSVAAFAVGPDGLLSLLNSRPTGGGGTCHVSVDAAGKRLYAANYGGGSIASFPLASDGSLGERDGFVQFTGSGPNPNRQEKPHAHSIYPHGEIVYACDLGTDRVDFFRNNAPLTASFGSFHAPAGAGPRHVAFGDKRIYLVNEMGMSLTAFTYPHPEISDGIIGSKTVPLLSEGMDISHGTAAEIVLHPNGKWLYVSVRNPDVITLFALDPQGTPTRPATVPARVKTPRSIAVDPSGQWLIAAGQDDGGLAVFRIDGETGRLSPAGEPVPAGAPVCVVFTRQ